MTVIKIDNGLMLINPLPPTKELVNELKKLISIHGKVKTIVLPSASGLEHKIGARFYCAQCVRVRLYMIPHQNMQMI